MSGYRRSRSFSGRFWLNSDGQKPGQRDEREQKSGLAAFRRQGLRDQVGAEHEEIDLEEVVQGVGGDRRQPGSFCNTMTAGSSLQQTQQLQYGKNGSPPARRGSTTEIGLPRATSA